MASLVKREEVTREPSLALSPVGAHHKLGNLFIVEVLNSKTKAQLLESQAVRRSVDGPLRFDALPTRPRKLFR